MHVCINADIGTSLHSQRIHTSVSLGKCFECSHLSYILRSGRWEVWRVDMLIENIHQVLRSGMFLV